MRRAATGNYILRDILESFHDLHLQYPSISVAIMILKPIIRSVGTNFRGIIRTSRQSSADGSRILALHPGVLAILILCLLFARHRKGRSYVRICMYVCTWLKNNSETHTLVLSIQGDYSSSDGDRWRSKKILVSPRPPYLIGIRPCLSLYLPRRGAAW